MKETMMFKVLYKGEKTVTITSQPPGVTHQVKPGQTVDVDGGFEYLKDDPSFEVLGAADENDGPADENDGPADENDGPADENDGPADEKPAKTKK